MAFSMYQLGYVAVMCIYLNDLPSHDHPSPVYPGRHSHLNVPTVLVQLAAELHPPLSSLHSLMSTSSQVKT